MRALVFTDVCFLVVSLATQSRRDCLTPSFAKRDTVELSFGPQPMPGRFFPPATGHTNTFRPSGGNFHQQCKVRGLVSTDVCFPVVSLATQARRDCVTRFFAKRDTVEPRFCPQPMPGRLFPPATSHTNTFRPSGGSFDQRYAVTGLVSTDVCFPLFSLATQARRDCLTRFIAIRNTVEPSFSPHPMPRRICPPAKGHTNTFRPSGGNFNERYKVRAFVSTDIHFPVFSLATQARRDCLTRFFAKKDTVEPSFSPQPMPGRLFPPATGHTNTFQPSG